MTPATQQNPAAHEQTVEAGPKESLAHKHALPASLPANEPAPQAVFVDGKERPISTGGRIFDWLTYGGIAGIGTFIITIPIANMFVKGGRFHAFDQWLQKSVRSLGASENVAEQFANTTRTMHGGNLILIPVAIMEKFRTPIVNAFNKRFNDPTDPKSVEESPPQTISAILKGRLIAWATVFTAFTTASTAIGKERFDGLLDAAGKKLCTWFKQPVSIVKNGETVNSLTYNIGHTGALDVLATASAATLLYITSHYFANSEARQRHMAQKRARESQGQPSALPHIARAETDQLDRSETAAPEKPSANVSHIAHESALASPAQGPQL